MLPTDFVIVYNGHTVAKSWLRNLMKLKQISKVNKEKKKFTN